MSVFRQFLLLTFSVLSISSFVVSAPLTEAGLNVYQQRAEKKGDKSKKVTNVLVYAAKSGGEVDASLADKLFKVAAYIMLELPGDDFFKESKEERIVHVIDKVLAKLESEGLCSVVIKQKVPRIVKSAAAERVKGMNGSSSLRDIAFKVVSALLAEAVKKRDEHIRR